MEIEAIKGNKPKMTKKKLSLLLGLLVIASVSAAWVLSYESNITGFVIGGEDGEMLFVDNFEMTENNNSEEFNKIEYINITNNDGIANMTININTTIVDVEDSCDNTDDVEVLVQYGSNMDLNDGDIISIQSGKTQINLTTSVVERACPSTVKTQISLN